MANHGLRTTGVHTGNFGRQKIQAKKESLDLTKEILNKENLRIPDRDVAFTRLVEAYNTSEDPKLRATLWEMLKRRRATLQPTEVKPNGRPSSPYWEDVGRVR
ncbi:MAG: hypothetical protein JRF07_05925 [Deltaproteobacteria bacterium]|jgi:hypothetical protein|nr:hypothetical protein [Deltaproteobacteria bacterium]